MISEVCSAAGGDETEHHKCRFRNCSCECHWRVRKKPEKK